MISESLKVKIQEWISKDPSVVASSITKDRILVRDDTTGKRTHRVGKYIIQISI